MIYLNKNYLFFIIDMNNQENNTFSDSEDEADLEKSFPYYTCNKEDDKNYANKNSFSDLDDSINMAEKIKKEYPNNQLITEIIKEKEKSVNNCIINIFNPQNEDLELESDKRYSTEESDETKSESKQSILRKKTERFNIKEEKELDKIDYRLDYYKKDFLKSFLSFIQSDTQLLINNCNFCKKFGNTLLHMPNRDLYTGNTKEKDNKEFMDKTIEEVFSDFKNVEENIGKKDGFSRQRQNDKFFKKVHNTFDTLLIKKEKDDKYNSQYYAVGKLINHISKTIDEALDLYYDSKEFKKFKSIEKIQYYDEKFKKERNRNFSLLDKGGFRTLVNLPFYSDKERAKKNKNVY